MRAADESFWELASTAARNGRRVLVMERIARGAGQTRWFLIRHLADVGVVSAAARPGSAIEIYLDPAVALEGRASQALLASLEPVAGAIRPNENDLVALALRDADPCCEHDFLDPDEMTAWLKEHDGQYVLFRYYPKVGEQDAEAIVPDDDGVVRGHPY